MTKVAPSMPPIVCQRGNPPDLTACGIARNPARNDGDNNEYASSIRNPLPNEIDAASTALPSSCDSWPFARDCAAISAPEAIAIAIVAPDA